jgi:hypothetical protein
LLRLFAVLALRQALHLLQARVVAKLVSPLMLLVSTVVVCAPRFALAALAVEPFLRFGLVLVAVVVGYDLSWRSYLGDQNLLQHPSELQA